jgi:hypothetical protein
MAVHYCAGPRPLMPALVIYSTELIRLFAEIKLTLTNFSDIEGLLYLVFGDIAFAAIEFIFGL